MQKDWHSIAIKKVFEKLKTSPKGLSDKRAEKRLKKYGLNRLAQEKSFSKTRIFLEQLRSPLVYILVIAGGVTWFLSEHTDTVIIFTVVFLNTVVGYIQESKANDALGKLKKILKTKVIVIRDGDEKEILQKYVVPGDVVMLRAGGKAPADLRLIEAHDLKMNESALTGEWLASDKKTGISKKEAILADRRNMVHMGTIIASGWGRGVVVTTGQETALGRLAEAVKETEEKKTPYQKKLQRFSKIMGIAVVFISLFIFIEGIITGGKFVEMFTTSIAVAVAAIPEGLPVAMTVVLALGMQKVLKKKGLVRKLSSAETLGSTSVIITDKTGTLTEAKMKTAGVFAGKDLFLKGAKTNLKNKSRLLALKIGLLCNESFIENSDEVTKKWIVRGRPTEKALFMAGLEAGLSKKELEKKESLIDYALFESVHKYAASLHKLNSNKNILYVVGSPEKLLGMSSFFDMDGKKRKLLLGDFKKIKDKIGELTKSGFRLVGAAYRETNNRDISKDREEKAKKLVFAGVFALHDPIRRDSKDVLDLCRQAGMRPIIATGDHKLTALAVANKLGFKTKPENVLEGRILKKMSDKELEKRLRNIYVYARVEPEQKLRIVKAWQKRGEVVAMTGDGINDAPALKMADIGVALGSGTDVAKEVSDLVLLTDNFSAVELAVEEGRVIIDNIRKIITYLLSDSFTEVILISASLVLGLPLPITAAQILWVNLIEDGPLGISLAFEKKEKDIMKRKPHDYSLSLLTKEMKVIIFIIGFIADLFLLGLFVYLLKYSDFDLTHIRSIIFAGLTIDSIFYIFSCRSLRHSVWKTGLFSNKVLTATWILGVLMLLSAIYVPFLSRALKLVPFGMFEWSLVLSLGFIKMFLIEVTKYIFIGRKEK